MVSHDATKQKLIDNYRERFLQYRSGPSVGQWMGVESQTIRFNQIMTMADFNHQSVLDIGCGIGDFYPELLGRFPHINYSGIDLVPEVIECAKQRFPGVEFQCADVLQDPLIRQYDYVVMSGVFNNDIAEPTAYLKALIEQSFEMADKALAFNFLTRHTKQEAGLSYHNPSEILDFCIEKLSCKVSMFHHYARYDVCVFVYREPKKP